MGVAVQSHWFSVGSVVTWAEGGVGVVATQSIVEPSYGPLGLSLMRGGKTSEQALKSLLASDDGREVRQVAMLDPAGRVAAHTGKRCIPKAGHIIGDGFSVQANLMRSERVWEAMADSFRKSKGELAQRLIEALFAAEGAGGDVRGRQSAALLVVKVSGLRIPWMDKVVDLRVEDNPQPLEELQRLYRVHQAYVHANKGDEFESAGEAAKAMEEYRLAARLAPEIDELRFWHGVALLNLGRTEEGKKLINDVLSSNKDWKNVLVNLPAVGLLKVKKEVLESLFN